MKLYRYVDPVAAKLGNHFVCAEERLGLADDLGASAALDLMASDYNDAAARLAELGRLVRMRVIAVADYRKHTLLFTLVEGTDAGGARYVQRLVDRGWLALEAV